MPNWLGNIIGWTMGITIMALSLPVWAYDVLRERWRGFFKL